MEPLIKVGQLVHKLATVDSLDGISEQELQWIFDGGMVTRWMRNYIQDEFCLACGERDGHRMTCPAGPRETPYFT